MALLLKNLTFTILVPGTVAVFVPVCLIPHADPTITTGAWFAAVPMLAGSSIYAWCLWDFAVTGRGTPAPIDPPKALVVRGLYRYTRNPMYVGALCVIGGWALLFLSFQIALYGLGVVICFHLFVISYEEPHLRNLFGVRYREYCREVGRWVTLRKRCIAD